MVLGNDSVRDPFSGVVGISGAIVKPRASAGPGLGRRVLDRSGADDKRANSPGVTYSRAEGHSPTTQERTFLGHRDAHSRTEAARMAGAGIDFYEILGIPR